MLSPSQHVMGIKSDNHVLACSNCSINGSNNNNSILMLNISSAIMWKTLIYFVIASGYIIKTSG